jgi:hypothetical protein
MQLQQITDWLDDPSNYLKGAELYASHGNSEFLKKLFARGESAFSRSKLEEALKEIVDSYTPQEIRESVEVKKKYEQTIFEIGKSLPTKIAMMKDEKALLFRETLKLRNSLKELCPISNNGKLTVAECCLIMEQKDSMGRYIPFSIKFITWSEREADGGELICYNSAVLANLNNSGSRIVKDTRKPKKTRSNPNHWKNSTRNIHPENSWEIRKFNIWLMIEFNGKEVVMSNAG